MVSGFWLNDAKDFLWSSLGDVLGPFSFLDLGSKGGATSVYRDVLWTNDFLPRVQKMFFFCSERSELKEFWPICGTSPYPCWKVIQRCQKDVLLLMVKCVLSPGFSGKNVVELPFPSKYKKKGQVNIIRLYLQIHNARLCQVG